MKTEELESVYKLVKQSLKTVKFSQFEAKDKVRSRMDALISLNKLKTEAQIMAFFKNKPFIYKLDDATWFGFVIQDRQKQPDKTISTITAVCIMHRVYTSSGHIYYVESPNEKIVTFTSHFFDRYKERLHYKTKDAAIRAFLKDITLHNLQSKFEKIKNSKRRMSTFMSFDKGVGLGLSLDNIVTLKTFVSDDLLREKQANNKALLLEMSEHKQQIEDYLKEKNK